MNDNLYQRRVKEVMSKDVVAVHPHDTLREALELMGENRVSALPVTDRRGRCIGMLSTSDMVDLTRELDDDLNDLNQVSPLSREWLLEKLSNGVGHQKVETLMSNSVAVVGQEALLVHASREMLRQHVHRLPVVDDHQRLLGIVSTMDVLTAFSEGAPE